MMTQPNDSSIKAGAVNVRGAASASTILTVAQQYLDSGLSVIPIRTDGSKAPVVFWKRFQCERPSYEQLVEWFGKSSIGIAIVTGSISGDLEVLDFDDPAAFEPWKELVSSTSQADLLMALPMVQTPSGGYHIYYRCPENIGRNQQLAMRFQETGTPKVRIETRGEGGYVVAPGSPPSCHRSHNTYQLIAGDLKNVPTISPVQRAALIDSAKELNEIIQPKEIVLVPRDVHAFNLRPGDEFEMQTRWEEILAPHGWRISSSAGSKAYWTKPNSTIGKHHATTNYDGKDLLYCFSTNAHPFEASKSYSKFAAYAVLNHRGDFKAAAKSLMQRGYGEGRSSDHSAGTAIPLSKPDLAEQTIRFSQVDLAEQTIERIGAENLIVTGNTVHRWNVQGLWEPVHDRAIKQQICQAFLQTIDAGDRKKFTKSNIDGALEILKSQLLRYRHEFDTVTETINCKNGELLFESETSTWTLRSHTREHYRTTQIPVHYDPTATAPLFQNFLDQVFCNDIDADQKKCAILEGFGYSLICSCRYETFLLLVGEGANGKSTLISTLIELLGKENVANVQPTQLDNRFQRAHLQGKLANVITEIAEGAHLPDAALKAIVSGEAMTAERKHRDPFDFRPNTTCWFGTNHLPNTRDFSHALLRRALIIEFNNRFSKERGNCDPNLAEKLRTELPGILNLALKGLSRLFENGAFTEPDSGKVAKKEWHFQCDQVAAFVEERCTIVPDAHEVGRKLYDAYTSWAKESGMQILTRPKFLHRLKRMGPFPDKGTNGIRVVRGIALHPITGTSDERG